MRYAPALFIAALLGLLGSTSHVQGAYIPWQYSWTTDKPIIYSDSSTTSYLTMTNQSLAQASGSSDIEATNIKVFSDASPFHEALFTNPGGKDTYTLTMFLLDVDSGKSKTLTFSGILTGSISMFSSNLANQFVGPTTQQFDLGTNQYTVTFGPYTPPGPPGSVNSGAISAHASVTVTEIQKTPEPSTLLLALLGAPAIGYRVWRRRRDRVPA
jgi:PEP-CTERM motif